MPGNAKRIKLPKSFVFPPELQKTSINFFLNTREYKPISGSVAKGNLQYNFVEPLINKNTYQLPLPQSGLDEVFNLDYANPRLGALGGSMETIKTFLDDPTLGTASNLGIDAGAALVKRVLNAGSVAVLGQLGVGRDAAIAAQELLTGIVENPNLALAFKGIQLRNHVFSWKFLPRNKEESNTLKAMIKSLKSDSLPSSTVSPLAQNDKQRGNFVLNYPCVAFFKFVGPMGQDLITFNKKGSFIKNIKVSYSGGELAFFKDTFEPSEILLSIELVERSIITREDHDNSDSSIIYSDKIGT